MEYNLQMVEGKNSRFPEPPRSPVDLNPDLAFYLPLIFSKEFQDMPINLGEMPQQRNYDEIQFKVYTYGKATYVETSDFKATLRELEILYLIAQDLTYQQIGANLGITRGSVNARLKTLARRNKGGECRLNAHDFVTQAESYELLTPIVLKGIEQMAKPITRERSKSIVECEEMILRLVANGMTNAKIAKELNISLSMVKDSLEDIFFKLEVDNRTSAVIKAYEMGIVL